MFGQRTGRRKVFLYNTNCNFFAIIRLFLSFVPQSGEEEAGGQRVRRWNNREPLPRRATRAPEQILIDGESFVSPLIASPLFWPPYTIDRLLSLQSMSSRSSGSDGNGHFISGKTDPRCRCRFTNGPCAGGNGMNGTCYTEQECESRGGTNGGACASGFGICCLSAKS